jgi:hypothetical protein
MIINIRAIGLNIKLKWKQRYFVHSCLRSKRKKYNQKPKKNKKNFQVALDATTHVVKSVKLLLCYNFSVVLLANLTNPKQIEFTTLKY